MRAKILSLGMQIGAVLTGFVLSLALLFYFSPAGLIHYDPVTLIETASARPAPEPTSAGLPVRLKIPKININAVIEQVGILPDGSMGVPKLPRNTAWFKLGPRPGEVGSAVIDGHINWWNGATAVFAKLNKLKPGDKITVLDDKKNAITFVVKKTRLYGAKEDASDVFSSGDGRAHLNLITCGGVWNKRAKEYSKRLVVFTDRE
ncbi:MAG: class F sortase [bacterium]|nr:class F sortase [bacterium]